MSETAKFSCVVDTLDNTCPLGLEIWLDDQQIFNENHVTDKIFFEHELSDTDGQHELKFVMKGKTAEHTKIDSAGQILQDARLVVTQVKFDQIELGQVFTELATYTHDFNGTGPTVQDRFFSEIGCNGTVSLKFSTPIYLWLLENI